MMNLELAGTDRNLLASMLMRDEEPLTAERLEGAVRALRRMQLRRRLEQIQIELQSSRSRDPERHAVAHAGENAAQTGTDGPQPDGGRSEEAVG